MYFEKMNPILNDLENKEIEIAGGSVVGMALSTINSLIKYIANLTINKKNYEDVQEKVKEILEKAENLKQNSLEAIDKDKEILEEILNAYKIRKENSEKYAQVCKEAVDFCMSVVNIANETLKLSDEISKVGNKMLSSDFKICKYYSIASIQSAMENVYINLKSVEDENYVNQIEEKCKQILEGMQKYV
ncbi:MAG: cyclodeaminase/cyclohydrolase family protein [Clostridia bacterium]|nr:cyclodeaminase/cyclohydrolase family protein [Clostridia bacterium]